MTPVHLIFVVALAWEVGLGCKGYAQLGEGFTAPSDPCSSMQYKAKGRSLTYAEAIFSPAELKFYFSCSTGTMLVKSLTEK